jgi:hypothetical protein
MVRFGSVDPHRTGLELRNLRSQRFTNPRSRAKVRKWVVYGEERDRPNRGTAGRALNQGVMFLIIQRNFRRPTVL